MVEDAATERFVIEGFTATNSVDPIEFVHPLISVPGTVYVVLTFGETTLPLLKLYVMAPLGTIVKELPEQILPPFTIMVGFEFTVTLEVAKDVDEQPAILVPVTVYVALAVGVLTALPP